MARIRTIKPEFWAHEELSSLPESVHILAAALLNYADDDGYFNANHQLVKAVCFPIREPSVTIHVGLRELSRIGYIYTGIGSDGKNYGRIVKFKEHQVINKPTKSKISLISITWGDVYEECSSATVVIQEDYQPERKGKERKGKKICSFDNERLSDFIIFWDEFDFKRGKGGAESSWMKISNYSKELFEEIIKGAKREAQRRPQLVKSGISPKWPQGWITERRWEDEYEEREDEPWRILPI